MDEVPLGRKPGDAQTSSDRVPLSPSSSLVFAGKKACLAYWAHGALVLRQGDLPQTGTSGGRRRDVINARMRLGTLEKEEKKKGPCLCANLFAPTSPWAVDGSVQFWVWGPWCGVWSWDEWSNASQSSRGFERGGGEKLASAGACLRRGEGKSRLVGSMERAKKGKRDGA